MKILIYDSEVEMLRAIKRYNKLIIKLINLQNNFVTIGSTIILTMLIYKGYFTTVAGRQSESL